MDFFHDAGWGIYPVLLFGTACLGAAIPYAVAPRRDLLPLVVGFGVATILAGLLGAVTGLQKSVEYLGDLPPADRWIFLLGLRESLNNVVAAFVITVVATLLTTVGGYRLTRRAAAAVGARAPSVG